MASQRQELAKLLQQLKDTGEGIDTIIAFGKQHGCHWNVESIQYKLAEHTNMERYAKCMLSHTVLMGHWTSKTKMLLCRRPYSIRMTKDRLFLLAQDSHCLSVSEFSQHLTNTNDVNYKDAAIGGTMLLWAVMEENEKEVKDLLEKGADPNIATKAGETPLHVAVAKSNLAIITLLLQHKANPNLQNCFGDSPIFYACSQKVVDHLLPHLGGSEVRNEDKLTYSEFFSTLEVPLPLYIHTEEPASAQIATFSATPPATLPENVELLPTTEKRATDVERYKRLLDKRAEEHGARLYHFLSSAESKQAATEDATETESGPGSPTPTHTTTSNRGGKKGGGNNKTNPNKGVTQPKKKANTPQSTREQLQCKNLLAKWKEWLPLFDPFLPPAASTSPSASLAAPAPNYHLFQQLQVKLLAELSQPQGAAPELVRSTCKEVLWEKIRLVIKRFVTFSCPKSGNPKLLDMMKNPIPPANTGSGRGKSATTTTTPDANADEGDSFTKKKINYTNQFKCLAYVDSGLDQRVDPRCIGFQPTVLQRAMMDCVDNNNSLCVRAPAGSGKTMLVMYLARKMKERGKRTIYIGPNKAVCREASLFVHIQKELTQSVGDEDFFDPEELQNVDVLVCGMRVLTKLLLFHKNSEFMSSVGAIVFDELPRIMRSSPEFCVLFCSAVTHNWLTMSLSATMTDEIRDFMLAMIPSTQFIELKTAVRPTDTHIYEAVSIGNGSNAVSALASPIPIFSTYTYSVRDDWVRAFRFAVPYEQFKELCTTLPEPLLAVLPTDRVINGADMTKFAVEKAKLLNSFKPDPPSSSSSSSSSDVSDSDDEVKEEEEEEVDPTIPTPRQIYALMEHLSDKARLPVLFFHKDKKQLDKYFEAITELLDKKFPPKSTRIDTGKPVKDEENRKKATAGEEEEEEEEERETPFGKLNFPELAQIFGSYFWRGKELLARRGKLVQGGKSYLGLSLGVGIHHHSVGSLVCEAVEAGLRCHHLGVVFCDTGLGLGINLPVKTVVFVGGRKSSFSPEEIVQAAGRAGRWGYDKVGDVLFLSANNGLITTEAPLDTTTTTTTTSTTATTTAVTKPLGVQHHKIWKNFDPLEPEFPLSLVSVLALCASPILRPQVSNWLASFQNPNVCNYWSWDKSNEEFVYVLDVLKSLGLVGGQNEVTSPGWVALTLMDDHERAIFAGLVSSHFDTSLITSQADFLYIVTHFLPSWRVHKKKVKGPTLEEAAQKSNVDVSPGVQYAMRGMIRVAKSFSPALSPSGKDYRLPNIPCAEDLTGLYMMYTLDADNRLFYENAGNTKSEVNSLLAHFLERARLFQGVVQLPFGDAAVSKLNTYLNG